MPVKFLNNLMPELDELHIIQNFIFFRIFMTQPDLNLYVL